MASKHPRPTALKLLNGVRKSRINTDEPQAEIADDGQKPSIKLSSDELKEFNAYREKLTRQRILTENDIDMLSIYVREFFSYKKYQSDVEARGGVLVNDKGNEYINPSADLANRCFKNFMQIAPHFGFSPSTRSKIATTKAEEVNPFEQLKKVK
jgi:P27 family predicted phage terminase small subunit